jgi:DNA-directed RNA polymerase subunit M/transcription elongation factor TFIIS
MGKCRRGRKHDYGKLSTKVENRKFLYICRCKRCGNKWERSYPPSWVDC